MLSDRTSTALTGVSKATLNKGVRIKHLFRIMTHCPDLWMTAYAKIYANKGAMTKGVNDNSLDGMCQDRIENLIQLLKDGRYHPQPVRRVFIPKKNGKLRPLGIPTGDDKLVQEVVRSLLELIYEPVFSENSHGFRPQRSCHTALIQMSQKWKGIKWVVDMDISGFYDNIDHEVLLQILQKKIDDTRFIDLIKQLLQAGYMEEWQFHNTYSGTPQGGICSPILANIFLNELDTYVQQLKNEFDLGESREPNPEHKRLKNKIKERRRKIDRLEEMGELNHIPPIKEEIKGLAVQQRQLPSGNPYDPGYKRLHYTRYADDFVCGIIGSKQDAEAFASKIKNFVNGTLKLQIAEEKSGIRHIKKGFNFLGYHVSINVGTKRLRKSIAGVTRQGKKTYALRRTLKQTLFFQVPRQRVWDFCKSKGYLRNDKPIQRANLLHLSDYEIVSTFNAEMRGFANYFALAQKKDIVVLEWAGLGCLFKTLANKHKTSSQKLRSKMKHEDDHFLRYEVNGEHKSLKVFKLKYRKEPDPSVTRIDVQPPLHVFNSRSELVARLNANQCEYCGKTRGYFEVHHVRKLADVKAKKHKAPWEIEMCSRNRKTLILCVDCHQQLHHGKLQGWKRNSYTEMESAVR